MFKKTRARVERRRILNDRELITHGAHFAARNEHMPVLCGECGRYGHFLGAVAARTHRGVSILDRTCANEGGIHFLSLGECLQRAVKLRIRLNPERVSSSPIGVITTQPEYENAALLYNATSGTFMPTHIAQIGAVKRGG